EFAFRFRPERMDDEHRRGLRHRFYYQHPRHDWTRRKMTLKITLVDGHVLDPGRPLVRHHVDDLVDHQKGMAMWDHFHDPLNIHLCNLLFFTNRSDHHRSFFLARRCSTAVCLMNSGSGTAGLPHTVWRAATSRMRPLLA